MTTRDEMFEQAHKLKGATPEIDEVFEDKPEVPKNTPVAPVQPHLPPVLTDGTVPPLKATLNESSFVVFTEVEKDGFVWHPTFRDGTTPAEIDRKIDLMEAVQKKLIARGWKYHEKVGFAKKPFVKAEPKLAGTNCQKCGAPESVSQAGKSYCSKLCWKNQ